jgi:hypothetical protein
MKTPGADAANTSEIATAGKKTAGVKRVDDQLEVDRSPIAGDGETSQRNEGA